MHLGLFDSGIGGLSVAACLLKKRPGSHITYFADTAHTPWGNKDPHWLKERSATVAQFLQQKGCTHILVCCGTASSIALQHIQKQTHLPVLGVVDPLAQSCSHITRGPIAVIATEASISSGYLVQQIQQHNQKIDIQGFAAPEFVPLLENGCTDTKQIQHVVEKQLRAIHAEQFSTLVLGCTHYPLLKTYIKQFFQQKNPLRPTTVIDIAEEAANYWNTILPPPIEKSAKNISIFCSSATIYKQLKIETLQEKELVHLLLPNLYDS